MRLDVSDVEAGLCRKLRNAAVRMIGTCRKTGMTMTRMKTNERARPVMWALPVTIATIATVAAIWTIVAAGERDAPRHMRGDLTPVRAPGMIPSDGQLPDHTQSRPNDAPNPPAEKMGPATSRAEAAAEAAGVELVTTRLMRRVAQRFAARRWGGCRIGPGSMAYAPDGLPEACFYVVLKPGVPEVSMEALVKDISALREQRIELERGLANRPPGGGAKTAGRIRSLWRSMRGDKKYATVVVGANDGREPFIASFDGLPPGIFLREEAIEVRRKRLGGKDPGEPRIIWLPPLFTVFEFSAASGSELSRHLGAEGTELREISLPDWERQPISREVLQRRRAKWQSTKETPDK